MKTLICSYMSIEYAHLNFENIKYWNTSLSNCDYFVSSMVCKDWPKDFNISKLKNICISAAKQGNYDWMILLPGIDCSLLSIPSIEELNSSIIYTGYKTHNGLSESCSLHLYSKKIFCNHEYDENFRFFYDDYDFFYNETKNIPKQSLDNFICHHIPHKNLLEDPYVSLITKTEHDFFLRKYKTLHGHDFYNRCK